MTRSEMKSTLQSFIDEIMSCMSREEAQSIKQRIELFYNNNEVPEDIDVLAESGMCEMLAMIAD